LDIVGNLNCKYIPDNDCSPDNCSFCISDKYPSQDKIIWNVSKNETKLKITYSGFDRRIELKEFSEGVRTVTTVNITTTTIGGTSTVKTTTSATTCSPDSLARLVDSNLMVENVRYLSQQPRVYHSSWDIQTADYIKNKLASYGLANANFEDFGSNGRNVVGEIGTGKSQIIVVGGHRDSVNVPGAVDNAGGAAVVMEIARVLNTCKDNAKNNIRFVLFDGEEQGLWGSIAYTDSHSSENIIRMFNFDCEGHKGDATLTVFRTADASIADQCCKSLNIPCNIVGAFSIPGASSDHAPFAARGIQYIYPLTRSCNSYHTQNDNMNEISGDRMEWAAKLTVCVIAKTYMS
jgi:hypothetical protein